MLTYVYFYALHIFITCNYLLQDDMLKLFLLTFQKIYECLIKNSVSNIEISKETNQTREPYVTYSYIWHINKISQSVKIQYFRQYLVVNNVYENKTQ